MPFGSFCYSLLCICLCTAPLIGAEAPAQSQTAISTSKGAFEPFTGRIRRNKVRMRIKPDVNSPIVSELPQSVLIAVVGEQDEFYAVRPTEKIKVYVYRTYVLNHTVDVCRINVRLHPSTDAPIVGQLYQGDQIEGRPSSVDDQWIEIDLPDSLAFYVAREFIEKAGPVSLLATMQAREEELQRKQRLLAAPQDARTALTSHMASHALPMLPPDMPESMTVWIPREQHLFNTWHIEHPQEDITAFYAAEALQAITLKGIIQPYTRTVQNKPGNFILIHPTENYPVAFLYSTQVDLQPHIGNTLSLLAVPRPNYHFAFPAFFILSIL